MNLVALGTTIVESALCVPLSQQHLSHNLLFAINTSPTTVLIFMVNYFSYSLYTSNGEYLVDITDSALLNGTPYCPC